jgi:DNA-binding FrmR family transcriptional regulator
MSAPETAMPEACVMNPLGDEATRHELLNRLKRAEGQLRGIQRMIEEGQPCMDIASQLSAVRKALDSTCVRMTVCFMQAELTERLKLGPAAGEQLEALLDDVQVLLSKAR